MSYQDGGTDPGGTLDFHPGSDLVTVEDYGTLITDRFGLSTCTSVLKTPATNMANLPDIFADHPLWTALEMEHREVSIKNGFAIATCSYAGYIPPSGQEGNAGATPVAETVLGTSEDPIDTHPNFVSAIGGTAMEPLNGAVFRKEISGAAPIYTSYALVHDATNPQPAPASNDGWQFDHFDIFWNADDPSQTDDQAPGESKQNIFAKQDSYLSPFSMTYRITQVTTDPTLDTSSDGYIDDPPTFEQPDGVTIKPPDLAAPRNWLNMGTSQTQRGACFTDVTEWRASGPFGWNPVVYTNPNSSD